MEEEEDWKAAWNQTDRLSINGLYQVGDELGHGAVGRVFRGLNMRTGEVVAIKQIDKSRISRENLPGIMAELDILQQLYHPNVVQFIEHQETQDFLYFVMEFVEGGSLYATIKRFGNFPEKLLVIFITQVLRGLKYLHSKGVVHRDIKGANILLSKEGQCKLTDFGSCTYEVQKSKESMVGTPFWMAPEMIEGTGGGFPADIWSLGCTIIELLTGKPPFWDFGPELALFKMMNMPNPPIPKNISPDLDDFIRKCFIKQPEERLSAIQLLNHKWITNIWGGTPYEEPKSKDKDKKKNKFKKREGTNSNPNLKAVSGLSSNSTGGPGSNSSSGGSSSGSGNPNSSLGPSVTPTRRGSVQGDNVELSTISERERDKEKEPTRTGRDKSAGPGERGTGTSADRGSRKRRISQNEEINIIIQKLSSVIHKLDDQDFDIPEGLLDFVDAGKTAVPLFFLQQDIRDKTERVRQIKKELAKELEKYGGSVTGHENERNSLQQTVDQKKEVAQKLQDAKKLLVLFKKRYKKEKTKREQLREEVSQVYYNLSKVIDQDNNPGITKKVSIETDLPGVVNKMNSIDESDQTEENGRSTVIPEEDENNSTARPSTPQKKTRFHDPSAEDSGSPEGGGRRARSASVDIEMINARKSANKDDILGGPHFNSNGVSPQIPSSPLASTGSSANNNNFLNVDAPSSSSSKSPKRERDREREKDKDFASRSRSFLFKSGQSQARSAMTGNGSTPNNNKDNLSQVTVHYNPLLVSSSTGSLFQNLSIEEREREREKYEKDKEKESEIDKTWIKPGTIVQVRTINVWNDAVIMSNQKSGRYCVMMIGSANEDYVKIQDIRKKPELKRVESAKLRRNISQTITRTISQWRNSGPNGPNNPLPVGAVASASAVSAASDPESRFVGASSNLSTMSSPPSIDDSQGSPSTATQTNSSPSNTNDFAALQPSSNSSPSLVRPGLIAAVKSSP